MHTSQEWWPADWGHYGNLAHDDMGLTTFGFAFGRPDDRQSGEVF